MNVGLHKEEYERTNVGVDRHAMPLRVRVERPVRWPVPHSSFASKGRNKAMTRALPAYRRFKAARRLSVPEQ